MPEANGTIEFLQYHQPALKDGDYQIEVEQTITAAATTDQFTAAKAFTVSGERFMLQPADVHAVFPPSGSLGDHFNVLPHIILNRSTMPWERTGDPNREDLPWLALLLFEEQEKPNPQILTLAELKNTSGYAPIFPDIQLESGQHDDDKVTVIDVRKDLLTTLLPSQTDLAMLSHVRWGEDNEGNPTDDEKAVIIGNRLPRKNRASMVHLVSIECRYNSSGFDYQGASDADLIRLVSLKSWRFNCIDPEQCFTGLVGSLNRKPGTLRLPENELPEAEKYLSEGYVALPYTLRLGDQAAAWYHGPLASGMTNHGSSLVTPVRVADELIRYNPGNGMFDVSYAAAWELGRLLALQSKHFSVGLYNWKRCHVHQLRQMEQQLLHPHLPPMQTKSKGEAASVSLPAEISNWFESLSLLQGVPFNYLVPDERMLPIESLRFFSVDSLWIDALLDGAFSIGRVLSSDHKHDRSHGISPAANPHQVVTGFLLRSTVVSGWPGLQVDAYDDIVATKAFIPLEQKLPLLRMQRLSADVLLCLFEGEIKTLDLHQKPETLHFGLEHDDAKGFSKTPRNNDGEQTNEIINSAEIPWHDDGKRVLDISGLADIVKNKPLSFVDFTSAQFSLSMIEGVQKVRFSMKPT